MPMTLQMRGRLAVMMFVQYFIWGAWYVSLGPYLSTLKFKPDQIGLAYGTTAIGAMVSPFFVGMIADRFFSTERILAVLHLCGGALLLLASYLTHFGPFFAALLGATLCYMPTLALTNSLSFHQMKDVAGDFPLIKTLGSIGWIGANAIVGGLEIGKTPIPFRIGALAAVAMSLYSLSLPHTPPRSAGVRVKVREVLGLDALKLMRQWSFAVFVVGSFLVCIPLSFYFTWGNEFLKNVGMNYVELKMTLGQVSDVVFLLLMPLFYARLGVKKMLLLGMAAWAGRFALFAYGNNNGVMVVMLFTGILMHGICYDFFFVMGQVYVDDRAPAAIRATAQGFIAFVTLGMGMFVGSWLSGVVVNRFTSHDAAGAVLYNWRAIWLTPAIAAGAFLVLFAILFRDRGKPKSDDVLTDTREAQALEAAGAAPL